MPLPQYTGQPEKSFTIHKTTIAPGENTIVRLNVARLPSGTSISIHVHVYRSTQPGPTILVLGGIHGDEINGIETVRRTISSGLFKHLQAGSVIAIPIVNIYGFINFSRDVTEGKDINRSFPGNMRGSLAARVAATLSRKILPLADFGIDYHTGGSSRYNYPQIRYTAGDPYAESLAKTFGAPYLISKSAIPKSLRRVAHIMKIPMLVYEGGESLRFDGYSIQKGIEGLKRLLYAYGMIDKAPSDAPPSILLKKTSWIRANRAGIFRWSQSSGARIIAGQPLGKIHDPYGEIEVPVLARRDGYIIGHNNVPVVEQGAPLFHVAYDHVKLSES